MLKRILTLALAGLTLTACASGTMPTVAVQPLPQRPLQVSEADMQDCGDLPAAKSGALPDLLANHVAVTQQYKLCRDSKGRVVSTVRRYQGDAP